MICKYLGLGGTLPSVNKQPITDIRKTQKNDLIQNGGSICRNIENFNLTSQPLASHLELTVFHSAPS